MSEESRGGTAHHNNYEGNGWSKYQIMVLQQLDDHNQVLQNMNKELVEVKQKVEVTAAETRIWKTTTATSVENLEKKMNNILYEDTGISHKVNDIRRGLDVEDKASTKHKAVWAIYGAIIVFLINVGLQVVHMIFFK